MATATSAGIAGILIGACLGFYGALGASLPISRGNAALDVDSDCEGSSEKDGGGLLPDEEYKMVLVVRTDLKMSRGKAGAQCAHAAVACYKAAANRNQPLLAAWENCGQPKICLQTSSEEDLATLYASAMSLRLTAKTIQDAGRTEVPAGSTTVLGIGPAPVSQINIVTGHLKLF